MSEKLSPKDQKIIEFTAELARRLNEDAHSSDAEAAAIDAAGQIAVALIHNGRL
jgi:hypothetical protein